MQNKKLYVVALIVLIIIVGVSISKNSANSQVIKIGYFGPFTGPVAGDTGADVANGFRLAAAQNNTIDGKKVQVIYEDDACDPQKAAAAANKLISVDKVKILVSGVCSGSTLAAAPIAEQNKVILLTPISTSPKITDAGDYVFRTSASSVQTAKAVSALIEKLGFTKVAILFENADYTVGWKDAFIAKYTENSQNAIVASEGVNSKDTDVKTQILKLVQAKPQALVYVLNSAVTGLNSIKQTRDLKVSLPIIGDEYFSVNSIVQNPVAEGVYGTVYKYDSNSPALKNLLAQYRSTYHAAPSTEIYPAMGYDGYNVLFNALSQCKSDNPDCVKNELYKVSSYQGVSGVITIDSNGDTAREFTLKQIHNGAMIDVQ